MEHKEIKKGLKQVELDRGVFNISVFFAIFFGILAFCITRAFAGTGWSVAVGLIVLFAIGIPAANRYYEVDDEK